MRLGKLGGRTGFSVSRIGSEPVFPLRSVLTAKASLYSLFILDLAARGECRPWPRPPPTYPPKTSKRLDRSPEASAKRIRARPATFVRGLKRLLCSSGQLCGVRAKSFFACRQQFFVCLLVARFLIVPHLAPMCCIKAAGKQQN